ncbi:MAG: T9SS type A sorting domain-containing protein [Candidatus Zixiibacteriota bacterium]
MTRQNVLQSAISLVCFALLTSAAYAEPDVCGPPVFVDCPQYLSVDHCDTISYQLKAVHPITMQPSPAIRYHKEYGPGHVDELTGVWTLIPSEEATRNHSYLVVVSASLGSFDSDADHNCSFNVWVDNEYPRLSLIGFDGRDTIEVSAEQTKTVWFRFSDSDSCDAVNISAMSVPPLPESSLVVTVSGDSAALSFTPRILDAGATLRVYVTVTDGWGASGFVLHFRVLGVPPYAIRIDKTHNVIQGQYTNVAVKLDRAFCPLSGFNMLVAYDNSALAFQSAQLGQAFSPTGCGWEYFTYRYGADGNCTGGCPSGLVRVVAMAETNNGPNHPSCFLPESVPATLFSLNFLVSNDRTLECQFLPVRFFWLACEDNMLASDDGQLLFISSSLADFDRPDVDISDPSAGFPTYLGAQANCETAGGPSWPPVRRAIAFINGGLEVACADTIDDPEDPRGDINFDGLKYHMADYILFRSYFLKGLSVFTINVNGQIAATDVNADGLILTLADLVWLYKVIIGDVGGHPTYYSNNELRFTYGSDLRSVSIQSVDTLGAISMLLTGRVTPTVQQSDVDLDYLFDGLNTRVIISPTSFTVTTMPPVFSGPLLTFDQPTIVLEAAAATSAGAQVTNIIVDQPTDADEAADLPSTFALHQNYPNPFNASTVISFDLPRAAQVELEIVNVLGAVVCSHSSQYGQGTHEVVWDGIDASGHPVASGIYYYRLRAGDFVESKKMILLK